MWEIFKFHNFEIIFKFLAPLLSGAAESQIIQEMLTLMMHYSMALSQAKNMSDNLVLWVLLDQSFVPILKS